MVDLVKVLGYYISIDITREVNMNESNILEILADSNNAGDLAYECSTELLYKCLELLESEFVYEYDFAFGHIRDILDEREIE